MNCPFCVLFLPDEPELWSPVGNDFFGEPARIGSIPACGECAIIVNNLSEVQRQALIAEATANSIAHFLAALATLLTRYVAAAREALLQGIGLDPDAVDAAEPVAIEHVPSLWLDRPSIYTFVDLLGYRIVLMECSDGTVFGTDILSLCAHCAGSSAYHYVVRGNHYCPKCFAEMSAVRPLSAGA